MNYYERLSRVELEYLDEDLKSDVIVAFQNAHSFSCLTFHAQLSGSPLIDVIIIII